MGNETINFLKDKDVTVLLRIHPAELSGSLPSNQKIYNEIVNRFNNLPANIKIIQPDDTLNSYSIIDKVLCALFMLQQSQMKLSHGETTYSRG